jgi:glycosyltransferase involved in cell wall biosynthesis
MREAVGLSAVVCVRGDERGLGECLASLGFAAEIVVVFDGAPDDSRAIAEAHGAKIVVGAFEREADRRHAGIDAAAGPWIFELDASDRVTPDLALEIARAVPNSDGDRHVVPVHNYIGRRLIRYGWGGAFGRGAYAALFLKGSKQWGSERVHATPRLVGVSGRRLKMPLRHIVAYDLAGLVARLNSYSSLRALDLKDKWRASGKVDESFGQNVRRIVWRFNSCYWGKKGYREGRWGFLIAVVAALYPILSFAKATLDDD